MREVVINEHTFVVGRLDPRRSFHVVRRLAPLVGSLADIIPYASGEKQFDPNNPEEVAGVLEPVAKGLAEMSDEDANYIIDTCLSVVQLRLETGSLASVTAPGGHLMFEWINMPMMIRLVVETVMENLQGFTRAGAPAS